MESLEDILTCKVCMEKYNDNDKKPLFLTCGHTFCSKCLRFIYKRPSLKCPLDKKDHKYETFTLIPTNFSVLNCLHSHEHNHINPKKSEKKCQIHPTDSLKFYCLTHESLIC